VVRSSAVGIVLLLSGAVSAAEDPIRSIALGDEHSCVLRASGNVACWGRNFSGQLGDGSRQDRSAAQPVVGLDGVQQIAAFGARTCAVRRDGALYCWGHVDGLAAPIAGQPPESWDSTVPRLIETAGTVAEVALGSEHLCVRDQAGGVRCWGKNDHGQLGDGTLAVRHAPVRVAALPKARSLALGTSHSCALVESGEVWCWGANEGGQLGDGTARDRTRATAIKEFLGTAQLVASGSSTCARLTNGTVRCWGWNSEGQLGDGTRKGHAIPKAVRGLEQVVELSLGATSACARRVDGSAWCWGDEAVEQPLAPHPQLDTDERRSLAPVERKQLHRVSALAQVGQIARGHQCVLTAEAGRSIVRCWGPNDHGQLGESTPASPGRVTQSTYGRQLE